MREIDSATSDAVRHVALNRYSGATCEAAEDAVAREEPLEIQVRGVPLAVVMRTPGHDGELVRGFLVTERVVQDASAIVAVRHCRIVSEPDAEDNVVAVSLREDVPLDLEALRRNFLATASCGVCGKATIERAVAVAPPIEDEVRFTPEFFEGVAQRLVGGQPVFAHTGGLHAAGLFAPDGRLLVVREDVGRHNAVDKVIGWAAERGRLPLSGHVLMVSGRISFEIAQKALAARLPAVAAVSAPSSLAVELAESAGLTLIGFLRGRRFNVYGRRERVVTC
ncbi:MAG: formate dehydrogenase accessory sulfurtransferase FdhD [Candidatus Binatia bacterium]